MLRFRPSVRATACTLIGVAAAATLAAFWFDPAPLPTGLAGRYFAGTDWSGPPLLEHVDEAADSAAFARHRPLDALDAWSAEWNGHIVARSAGLQRFAIKSDGGSWLWIGGHLVIDNGGPHEIRSLSADVFLERGVHPIRIRYQHRPGAERFLQFAQAGPGGLFLSPEPFLAEHVSYAGLRWRELRGLVLVGVWYAAIAGIVLWGLAVIGRRDPFRNLAEALADRTFLVVAAIGLAVSAAHIAYGLPAHDSWSADERDPLSTLALSHTGFDHWNLRWPPMHLYVIAFALRPFEWAASAFGLPMGDLAVTSAMFLVMRLVSLGMLAATLLLMFDIARSLADRRTGYAAVVFLACSPVIVYFGPLVHLETPHLFWMTASWWTWLALARRRTAAAFALFGATVGFSLATKDQAYGFYLGAPVACLFLLMQPDTPGSPRRRWTAALGDRRIAALGAATLGAFAIGHALPWYVDRFVDHLVFLTGGEVSAFRVFPATAAGQVALLGATARSFVWAAGVPLAVSFLAGCVLLATSRAERRLLVWLAPVATYYVAFVCVILYVYDRFLIGALPVVALIGAFGLRTIFEARDLPARLRMAMAASLIGTAVCGAIAQNVVFRNDPRRSAAAWLAAHAACGSSVGVTWNAEYVPALDCYDVWPLTASQIETVMRWPDYFVLNDAFVSRFRLLPSGQRFLQRLRSGEIGFERVFRAEGAPPWWAPLYWEDRFHNGTEDPGTTLDKPLNAIEVWRRMP